MHLEWEPTYAQLETRETTRSQTIFINLGNLGPPMMANLLCRADFPVAPTSWLLRKQAPPKRAARKQTARIQRSERGLSVPHDRVRMLREKEARVALCRLTEPSLHGLHRGTCSPSSKTQFSLRAVISHLSRYAWQKCPHGY